MVAVLLLCGLLYKCGGSRERVSVAALEAGRVAQGKVTLTEHFAVPFAMAGASVAPDRFKTYDEAAAAQSQLAFDEGWKLMRHFLGT